MRRWLSRKCGQDGRVPMEESCTKWKADWLVEELAPTALKHREKTLVDFYIVGIGFPLIPEHTAHVVALKRLDGAFEEIGRFVGVALALRSGLLRVIGGAFAGPAHDEIVVFPVAENGWKFLFERCAVNPVFRARTAHSVGNQSDVAAQAVGKHASEVEAMAEKWAAALELARCQLPGSTYCRWLMESRRAESHTIA